MRGRWTTSQLPSKQQPATCFYQQLSINQVGSLYRLTTEHAHCKSKFERHPSSRNLYLGGSRRKHLCIHNPSLAPQLDINLINNATVPPIGDKGVSFCQIGSHDILWVEGQCEILFCCSWRYHHLLSGSVCEYYYQKHADVGRVDETVPNAAWYYPEPFDKAKHIKDFVAFCKLETEDLPSVVLSFYMIYVFGYSVLDANSW